MKPIKQTVYLPVKVKDELPLKDGEYCVFSRCNTSSPLEDFATLKFQNGKFQEISNWKHIYWLKPQEAFVFTSEQLNEYTANIIKQALETAAEKAKIIKSVNFGWEKVDKESITNTFEETFKKFEV